MVEAHSGIHTQIVKSNSDIFCDVLYVSMKSSIMSSLFRPCLKTADITPIYKKGKKELNDNDRPYRFYIREAYSSYMREAYSSKYLSFLKIFSQKSYMDLGKATAHNNDS